MLACRHTGDICGAKTTFSFYHTAIKPITLGVLARLLQLGGEPGMRAMSAQPPRKTANDRSSSSQCREMKARQSAKIREIGDALRAAGYVSLDEQAVVLGLSRSTAWTLLRVAHKSTGLSATVINRILAASGLPPAVRETILEYVKEKAAGLHGHGAKGRRTFVANLSTQARSVSKQTSRSRA